MVRGGSNDVGPVSYDESKNSKWFILFSKYVIPLISFLVIPGGVYISTSFGKEPGNKAIVLGDKLAFWIFDDIISIVSWPIGMTGILWTIYLWTTPQVLDSAKKR